MQSRDALGLLRLEDGRRWIDAAYPWQLADAEAILDGSLPFHFLTRARGGSKTSDLAAVALSLLLAAKGRERLYWLAADAEQGRLAIDAAAGYCDRTPELREALLLTASTIEAKATGARLDVLAADAASSWGLRPAAVFVDELTQWPETSGPRRLWESVSSAVAKRADARLVVLCTAGDPAHFSRTVLDHALTSPLWRVHEVPGPSPWTPADRLAEQRARLLPSTYARLFENVWTAGEDRLASPDELRECVTLDGPLEPDPAHRYLIALDLGLKRDRTVAAVAHREHRRVVLDRMEVWQGSRLRPVKLEAVEEWLIEASRRYNRARIVLDPWQAVGTMQRLKGKGIGATEYPFTAQSVARLAVSLFNAIRDRAVALPPDDELLDELAHVRLRESSPGVFRLGHDAGRHDDRAIALALVTTTLLQGAVSSEGRLLLPPDQRIGRQSPGRGSTATETITPGGNRMHSPPVVFPPGTPAWQRRITRKARGG
jgi:hypothetical protein